MPHHTTPDVEWRQRNIRQYFHDSIPATGGTRSAGSAETFSGPGAIVDTGAGADKEWVWAEDVANGPFSWSKPQEVIGFFYNGSYANSAGNQGYGITLGGGGSVVPGAVQSADKDFIALWYNKTGAKWQVHVYATGDAAAPEETDCQVNPSDTALIWLRLLYVPNDTTAGGRKTIRCYTGNPPRLIHTQRAGRMLNLGTGASYGAGLFAYSGTHAAGRVSNLGFNRIMAVSHQALPGG